MLYFLIIVALILIGIGILIDRKSFFHGIFSSLSRARNIDEIEKMEEKIRELERRLEGLSQLEESNTYKSKPIVEQGNTYIPQPVIKQRHMYNQEPIMENTNKYKQEPIVEDHIHGLPFTDIELGFQEISEDFQEVEEKVLEVEEKNGEIEEKTDTIVKDIQVIKQRPKVEEKLKKTEVKFQEVYKESLVKTGELSLHSKIKIIQEYENRNKSIDEICELMNMKKGEVLLLKKLYKKS